MKTAHVFSLMVLFLALFLVPKASFASVMSYAQWKSQQITLAKSIYEDALIDSKRGGQEGLSRLRKARVKVVIAEELGPNDYVELYLSRHYGNNFKALQVAAGKMKASELAEILKAYSDRINRVESSPEVLPRSYSGSYPTSPFVAPSSR